VDMITGGRKETQSYLTRTSYLRIMIELKEEAEAETGDASSVCSMERPG
jgi:hypothetical protein